MYRLVPKVPPVTCHVSFGPFLLFTSTYLTTRSPVYRLFNDGFSSFNSRFFFKSFRICFSGALESQPAASTVPPAHQSNPVIPPGFFDQLMGLALAPASCHVAPRPQGASSALSHRFVPFCTFSLTYLPFLFTQFFNGTFTSCYSRTFFLTQTCFQRPWLCSLLLLLYLRRI